MKFSLDLVEQGLKLFELDINPNLINDGNIIHEAFTKQLVTQNGKENLELLLHMRSVLLLQSIQNCSAIINTEPIYPKLTINYKCKVCNGIGAIPYLEAVYVPNCNKCDACCGTGIKTEQCQACGGTGKKGRDICGLCRGSGRYKFKRNKNRKTTIICPKCSGTKYIGCFKTTGKIITVDKCKICEGKGQVRL